MSNSTIEIGTQRVLVIAAGGAKLAAQEDIRGLVEEAMSERARIVAVPAGRLDDSFFHLASGFAGELLQKFVNYQLKLAVVGDIERHVAASTALRDFIIECDRGNDVFFVADMSALEARLAPGALQT